MSKEAIEDDYTPMKENMRQAMTPTTAELRAAIENAIKVLGLTPDYGIKESSVKQDDADAAILRAHLETFDEDQGGSHGRSGMNGFGHEIEVECGPVSALEGKHE